MSNPDSVSPKLLKKFTEEEIKMLRAGFEEADDNGDGVLQKEEMKEILGVVDVQMSDEDFDRYFEMVDENGDGVISFEEWLKALAEEE